jgi:hypothetical protein
MRVQLQKNKCGRRDDFEMKYVKRKSLPPIFVDEATSPTNINHAYLLVM